MNHVTTMLERCRDASARLNAMFPRYERGPDIEFPDLSALDTPHPALLDRLDDIASTLQRIAEAVEASVAPRQQ